MARLTYPQIISRDKKYTALANCGLNLYKPDKSLIMTRIVDRVPSEHLNLLAEQWSLLGVDGWALAESDQAKRKIIKSSVELHRKKGSVWSIREVCRVLGFGEVEIVEGIGDMRYDGKCLYNGYKLYGGDKTSWAYYRIILSSPITNKQAELLRKTLVAFAPARCHLQALDYINSSLRYNGDGRYDGQHNFGSA